MYAWFDWEDQTTSVNSLNVIKTPRKEFDEYRVGEKVTAKLPQFEGLWEGVIVEMSVSRSMLMAGLKERQKKQIAMSEEREADSNQSLQKGSESGKKADQENTPGRQRHKSDSVSKKRNQDDQGQNTERKRHKSVDVSKSANKRNKDKVDVNKAEVSKNKEKKKEEGQDKLVAQKLLLDDIIATRRSPSQVDQTPVIHDTVNQYSTVPNETVLPSATYQQSSPLAISPPSEPSAIQTSTQMFTTDTWQPTFNNLQASTNLNHHPYNLPRPVIQPWQQPTTQTEQWSQNWSTPPQTGNGFANLYSNRELQEQNDDLRKENKALQLKIKEMEQKQDSLAVTGVPVTPRKLVFLKNLVAAFENKTTESESSHKAYAPTSNGSPPSPCQIADTPSNQVFQTIEEESETATLEEESETATPTDMIPEWEKVATENGVKKVPLLKGSNVFICQSDLSVALLMAGNDIRRLIVKLLEIFFNKEELAQSNATGRRQAHNATTNTRPLPSAVLGAIREFSLIKFKKESGDPAITLSEFNKVVNSKCSTARRGLK